MVFVTVGNAQQSFHRFLDAISVLVDRGFFGSEEVIVQSGQTPFKSERCRVFEFMSRSEFDEHLTRASLVITHGGTTALRVVGLGRIPVVMPRRYEHREHINDHQVEFVRVLHAEGWVVPVWSPEELESAIRTARAHGALPEPPRSPMADLVQQALMELVPGSRQR